MDSCEHLIGSISEIKDRSQWYVRKGAHHIEVG